MAEESIACTASMEEISGNDFGQAKIPGLIENLFPVDC
jgi:hypothetical protein